MGKTRMLLTAAVVAMLLTACGLQPASQFIPEVKPGPELSDYKSLDGATIVTGSKEFTEQLLLGKMLTLVLAAKGATVVDQTNTKGSTNSRQSIIRGDTDVQWEYTGTAWITYMGHANPDSQGLFDGVEVSDPDKLYEAVKKQDLADNDIYWAKPAPFNNTYTIAVTSDVADKYGLKTLSDMTKVPEAERTVCLENEFAKRADGWPSLLSTYGYEKEIDDKNVTIMDAGIVYSQIGKSCTFGEVYDTDGRIKANDLVTLKDDKVAFPIYNPAVNIRESINEKYPQIVEMFEKIGDRLDTEKMRELNGRVDIDGENPTNVAKDWLTEEGFLAPTD